MRIISGKYRGRKLFSPVNDKIRPTTDRIKETIFNVIQFRIANKRVLDLFAGTGAFGSEALSRGSQEVVFADNSAEAVSLVKQNLKKIDTDCQVWLADYRNAIERASGEFDAIFVDPPYGFEYGEKLISLILQNQLLSGEGVIVYEHSTRQPLKTEQLNDIIIKSKKMGSVTVDFIELG